MASLDFKYYHTKMLTRLKSGEILLRETGASGKRHYWSWFDGNSYSKADSLPAAWLLKHGLIELHQHLYHGTDRFVINENGIAALEDNRPQRRRSSRVIASNPPVYARHGRIYTRTYTPADAPAAAPTEGG